MRIGALRVHQKTLKGLYYAVGSFTVLLMGVALFLLLGMLLSPEAREMPLR